MNGSLTQPLTREQQKRLSLELYGLLARQVKHYHAHYRMGENSSVPAEVARELLDSIQFTLDIIGGYRPGEPIEEQLARGQALLMEELADTRALHRLVRATAPESHSQCWWETVAALEQYLDRYDLCHFAHRSPPEPDYPLLRSLPDGLGGIRRAKTFLHCLWLENQILEALPGAAALGAYAPPGYWDAPQNLCEQPLWNGLAKTLLGIPLEPLRLSKDERENLSGALEGDIRGAMDRLCEALGFSTDMREYALGALDSLLPRLDAARIHGNFQYLFW